MNREQSSTGRFQLDADVDALAAVRHHTIAIAATQRMLGNQLIKQGMHLGQAKLKLSPPAFVAWLADAGFTPSAAELVARAAELFGPHDSADQLHPGAMLALSAADAPPAAIAEAKLLSQRGRLVTHALACEIIAKHAARVDATDSATCNPAAAR